jgi:N-acetyl-anhydromuramyl-L-alanine amidase AmpD
MSLKINKNQLFTNFFTKAQDRQIDFIVLHHVCAKSFKDSIRLLKGHRVSSHYIINQDGGIFQLVEDKNIAYHAGVSFWQDIDGLNQNSIGIEFFHPNPYKEEFNEKQILSGINLCKYLKKKHHITQDVIGHNEIAYFKDSGFLGRKDDPSYLFDWEIFYQNNLTFSRKRLKQELLIFLKKFTLNQSYLQTLQIKNKLKNIGYKVDYQDERLDESFMETIKVVLLAK